MENRELLNAIAARRSIRTFETRPVPRAALDEIIGAARWAPSGMNNQPWRFVTIENKAVLEKLAEFSKYGKMIRNAAAAIAVFLDTESVYDRTKDVQSIGAATENLLLAAHALGLGACWVGEILKRRGEVEAALEVGPKLELMALVIMGYPKPGAPEGARQRMDLEKLIAGRF